MSMAVLQLDYVPMDQIAERPASWWSNVLGVVGFSKPPPIDAGEVPVAASMTPSLGTAARKSLRGLAGRGPRRFGTLLQARPGALSVLR